MSHPALRMILLAIPAIATGCGVESLLEPAQPTSVMVVGVEHLDAPLIPQAGLYRPTLYSDVDPGLPETTRVAGFFLDVASAHAEDLLVRFTPHDAAQAMILERATAPDHAFDLTTPPEGVRERLRAGAGVWWPTDNTDGIRRRLAVLLPESLLRSVVTLELSDSFAADGTPIRAATIEITRDFIYMGVIGDSVEWGNGLRESEKFSTIVAKEIERRLGLRVVSDVHAISGTKILPEPDEERCPVWCNGEVPIATTSVLTQVELLAGPDVLDLVLVDGCINDVGLAAILNPEEDEADLISRTQKSCGDDMLTLLRKLRARAGRATIIVTGYFQIISPDSSLPAVAQLLGLDEQTTSEQTPQLLEGVSATARRFLDTSRDSITAAVETVRQESPSAPIQFVDPGFGPENATFAPQAWLWGLTSEGIGGFVLGTSLTFFPEDNMAKLRAEGCLGATVADPLECIYASVGHPNVTGARVYANRILEALETGGLIPASQPQ